MLPRFGVMLLKCKVMLPKRKVTDCIFVWMDIIFRNDGHHPVMPKIREMMSVLLRMMSATLRMQSVILRSRSMILEVRRVIPGIF